MSRRGWIYIMSHPYLPGLVKVGRTQNDPVTRKEQLRGTNMPGEFVIEYGALVNDCFRGEKDIHQVLANVRVEEGREFFRCDIEHAIDETKLILNALEDGILYEGFCYSPNKETERISAISFPLIGLIRSLKEDYELTNHEIHFLGEWLNANPDAFDLWPGTKLVEPLNEYYKDGVLSKAELKLMSKLLQEIDEQFEKMMQWHEPGKESDAIYEDIRQQMEKVRASSALPPRLDRASE